MLRSVTADLDLDLGGSVDLVFQIAVACGAALVDERLSFRHSAGEVVATELADREGNRLHRLTAGPGLLEVRYVAAVSGEAAGPPPNELDPILYLRPSRYCPSDEVFAQARRQFAGRSGRELLDAVSDFVATTVTYTPGVSLGTDSATTTLRTGQGVCRDFAHLVIALLRAMDVPARYAACYAPGLEPMDFHAVAEAYLEGEWHVIDATRLSDRRDLVRIATGRDAADCAFLSFHGGHVGLVSLRVDAQATAARPCADDHVALVRMA